MNISPQVRRHRTPDSCSSNGSSRYSGEGNILEIEFYNYRTMIGSLHGSLVGDFFYMRNDILGYSEIIQPPSNVPCPGSRPVTPPRIAVRLIRIEMPEDIDVSLPFQRIQFRPFYRKESYILLILLGSCDINLAMADIEVAARDDLLFLIPQLVNIVDEVLVEFKLIT